MFSVQIQTTQTQTRAVQKDGAQPSYTELALMMQITRQALVQLRSFCPVAESTGIAAQRYYHKNVSNLPTGQAVHRRRTQLLLRCKNIHVRECAR